MAKTAKTAPADSIMLARDAACPAQFASVDDLKVAFHVDGPADAPVVLVIHGCQMTRKTWVLPAAPSKVRLVAITRPGYDESGDVVDLKTYGYDVFVSCVAAVMDKIGVDKFHVIGHSSGGPFALACKALLPQRCLRCLILAGDSEYATNPKLDTGDLSCCTPGRCCGVCGLCCLIPCVCRGVSGTCCRCSPPKKMPHKLQASKTMLGILKPAELAEIEQLGDVGHEWWAYQENTMNDSTNSAFRLNGFKSDVIVQHKPWPFKARLTDGTFQGKEVEFWAGEKDDTIKPEISEYSHSLVPGSSFHKVPDLGHQGMYFPKFISERYASLASGETAPQQQQMQMN